MDYYIYVILKNSQNISKVKVFILINLYLDK